MMAVLVVAATTKSTETNVVGMMMASKLSPLATNHPAATAAAAALSEASKTKRQSSETINFIQPEAEPEKKPER